MKHEIDHLIANALLDEGSIYLPNVGTLILVRHAAKRLSSRRLQPPYRELRFTGEQRGVSLVEYIAQKAGVTAERAGDIYNEYVAQSMRDGVFTIEELCTISNKRVEVLQQFEDMANSNGRSVVKINPRTNYIIYAVATLCALFALGVAGYVLYLNDIFNFGGRVAPAEEAFVAAVVEEQAPVEQVVEQTEPKVEAVEVAKPTAEPTEVVAEPVVEVTEPVETAVAPTILPMQRGKSYAVWGVYKELKNAEDAIGWLGEKFPSLEPKIYDYDGKYMVALYELSPRSAVGNKVKQLKAQNKSFKSVWVYTR